MLKKLAARIGGSNRKESAAAPGVRPAILDEYVRTAPSPQRALDIFKGDWWSSMPVEAGGLQAGHLPLFDDDRMKWANEALGGVGGKTILELGPLEGGHTYMLERAGARSILAIEANTRAYLKCLIAKEVVGLHRTRFLLGDFEEYLRRGGERFDAVIASGVVYHVRNPVELIQNISRITDRVFIWTQYYIAERVTAIPHMASRFGAHETSEHGGFRHTLHRYNYGDFLDTTRFAGGSEEFSNWLSREDLLGALRHVGLADIRIGQEEVDHTNGPAIMLAASRRR